MTADVVFLDGYRRNHVQSAVVCCGCSEDVQCYPHRLVDLLGRIHLAEVVVAEHRFVDVSTFDRLAGDVRDVLEAIVAECLPDEREVR